MPAKRKGKEIRLPVSIRLQPSDKEMIIKNFGSLQVWIDHCLKILQETKK
jgi:hypothetical protein